MATEVITVTVSRHTCLRCGYRWIGRDPGHTPKRCPSCGTPYWNRPRRLDIPATKRHGPPAGVSAMPLLGGVWLWPTDKPWGFYRVGKRAAERLKALGYKLVQRHRGNVYTVWHPTTSQPPAPGGWDDPKDPEKGCWLPGLRLPRDLKFRGERRWTRWRTPEELLRD